MQSRKPWGLLLVSLIALSAPSFVHAAQGNQPAPVVKPSDVFRLPKLDTDEDRLRWLISVREAIPNLFSDAAKYDIDLMKLLEDQNQLQKLLSANPSYLKALQEAHHSGWLDLQFQPVSNQIVKVHRIRPEAVESWKESLLKAAKQLSSENGKTPFGQQIAHKIAEDLKSLGGRNSQGLMSGLIVSLPPEKRALLSGAQTFQDKIKFFESNLPEHMGENFKAEVHGLPSNPSKQQVLQALQSLKQREESLSMLSQLHLVLQDGEGDVPKDSHSALNQISALDLQDLEFFSDPDALKPRIATLHKELEHNKFEVNAARFEKDSLKSIQSDIKAFSSQTHEVEEHASAPIRLKEVPPAVGIMRGCTGGDCSTQYSFPYPNAPKERVFFVYDSTGRVKGYVSGALVNANGKPSFYVITISGPRISAAETELILEGLNRVKGDIGAEQILLPAKESLADLINFQEIRSGIEKYQNGSMVDIRYMDVSHRNQIESFKSDYHRAEYDIMSKNTRAFVVKGRAENEFPMKIRSTWSAAPEVEAIKDKKLFWKRAYELASDFLASGRKNQVERILNAAGMSASEQKALMYNSERLPVAQFHQRLAHTLGLTEAEIEQRKNTLHEGYLRAPDAAQFIPNLIADTKAKFKTAAYSVLESPVGDNPEVIRALIEHASVDELHELLSRHYSAKLLLASELKTKALQFIEGGDRAALLKLSQVTYEKEFEPVFRKLMEIGDSKIVDNLVSHNFKDPQSPVMNALLRDAAKRLGDDFKMDLARGYFSHQYSMQSLDALKEVMDGGGYGIMSEIKKDLHHYHWIVSDDPNVRVLRDASKINDPTQRKAYLDQHYKPTDHHMSVGCIEGDLKSHLR